MTTQHIMNIGTLINEQNSQLQRLLKFDHQVEFPTSITGTQVTTCGSAAPYTRMNSVYEGKTVETCGVWNSIDV